MRLTLLGLLVVLGASALVVYLTWVHQTSGQNNGIKRPIR